MEARVSFTGAAESFLETSGGLYFTFGLALLIVFLVLAAQFESFIHPFIILLTVPVGVTGALLALSLTGQSINLYSQIGCVLLIGLMAKNGILIVEFANQMRAQGLDTRAAVLAGASQQFAADSDDRVVHGAGRGAAGAGHRSRRRKPDRHRRGGDRRVIVIDHADAVPDPGAVRSAGAVYPAGQCHRTAADGAIVRCGASRRRTSRAIRQD